MNTTLISALLRAGVTALQDYILLHVLTCLIPAFLLAGAMVTFIRREAILQHLGHAAGRFKSFSLATAASFLLAACSCTVIPVASGLYYSGAGIGAAFILLWVAPAANILSLTYTGSILGAEMVVVRAVSAVVMAMVVGSVMRWAFHKEEKARALADPAAASSGPEPMIGWKSLVLILLLVATLLAPNYLVVHGPYLKKILVWAFFTAGTALYAWRTLGRHQVKAWMRETWWFVRLIFPLLLAGVFVVGVIGAVLPEAWIQQWLGGNSLRSSFLATLIGSITYFATMTEAPFVHTLMSLGMGKGPAIALLLTGPGLSLPNWLAVAKIFGVKKALVYVPTLIVLGTLVGWIAGNLILR
jgi:uncharacterized membrane protein YraQ (UPF0718 family)